MHSYSLLAPAKINLYLEIIGDRADGFHELVMILQSIALADQIDLHANGINKIRVSCNHAEVPPDDTNLAYRAANLMKLTFPEHFNNLGGVDITIDKRIPVAAGLAGGSSNAAAVLVGLNMMWELGLTQPELQELAAKLGSDVPFCIAGGTAIATGRGERLDPITDLDNIPVILAKYRNLAVSTPWAYQTYRHQFASSYISDIEGIKQRTAKVHSGALVSAIAHQNSQEIAKLIHNDLEKVVLPEYPQVAQLKTAFAQAGVLGTMMSGSGPTVFALCASAQQAETVKNQVKQTINDPNLDFWVTSLSSNGIHVI